MPGVSRRTALKLLGCFAVDSSVIAAEQSSQIIDAHCHVGLGQALTAPWTTRASVELLIKRMDEAGVSKALVFPINNPAYEEANRAVAAICRKYNGRLIGFAKHDVRTEGKQAAHLLRQEVREYGLKGLKLHAHPDRSLMDAVAELGIPVLYHPDRVSRVHMLAQEYPGVPILIAHLGSFGSRDWTEHLAAIDIARRYENVYLETSGVLFQRYLELAVRELGAEKLIFGSDMPEVDVRVELYKIKLLPVDEAGRRKILGQNLLRLLPGQA